MTFRASLLASAFSLLSTAALAHASTYTFGITGPGVAGVVTLTYGAATDTKYPTQAYEVTGISGNFSDANVGISNAAITGLEPINYATPEPTNLLAPHDFSKFAVASGLPAESHGNITFDNLFWPAGSPQTGSDYPFYGGLLDVYGLLFDIGGGDVVNLWSNGVLPGASAADYGVSVANSQQALDYVGNGVAPTPEPGALSLMGTGALALWGAVRLRGRRQREA